MEYTIQNEILRVTAAEMGAELQSITHLASGEELLWNGDAAVWSGRAPLLFPHCGSVLNDTLYKDGKPYKSPRHGFCRTSPFTFAGGDGTEMAFVLKDNEQTRKGYPWAFTLTVRYRLEANRLLHIVEVHNPADEVLPFHVGFHPAFPLPFAGRAGTEGYEVAFDTPQTPRVLATPEGLISGEEYTPFEGEMAIPLRDDMFRADSLCYAGLTAQSMTLRHKDAPEKYVKVDVGAFPYVLLWSMPGAEPLQYLCIEPWHGVPDPTAPYGDFINKPGITKLAPHETYTTTLPMEFGR